MNGDNIFDIIANNSASLGILCYLIYKDFKFSSVLQEKLTRIEMLLEDVININKRKGVKKNE